MTLQKNGLGGPVAIPTSVGALLTVAASQKINIHGFEIHNTTGGSINVTIHPIVKNSSGSVGTPGTSTEIYTFQVAAGETVVTTYQPWPLILPAQNDTFQGLASASGVNILFLGDIDA